MTFSFDKLTVKAHSYLTLVYCNPKLSQLILRNNNTSNPLSKGKGQVRSWCDPKG